MTKFKLLAVVLSLAFATNASAQVHVYNFSEKISGTGSDELSFATLSFDDVISKFTLSVSSLLAPNAYVSSLAIDYDGKGAYPGVASVVFGGGVAKVTTSSAGIPSGDYNFRYVFGSGNDKLISGESVSWFSAGSTSAARSEDNSIKTIKIAGFNVKDLDESALRVQGLPSGKSGWYEMSEVSPVPEAETSGMMLVGLGLMGFIARRRRNF